MNFLVLKTEKYSLGLQIYFPTCLISLDLERENEATMILVANNHLNQMMAMKSKVISELIIS